MFLCLNIALANQQTTPISNLPTLTSNSHSQSSQPFNMSQSRIQHTANVIREQNVKFLGATRAFPRPPRVPPEPPLAASLGQGWKLTISGEGWGSEAKIDDPFIKNARCGTHPRIPTFYRI